MRTESAADNADHADGIGRGQRGPHGRNRPRTTRITRTESAADNADHADGIGRGQRGPHGRNRPRTTWTTRTESAADNGSRGRNRPRTTRITRTESAADNADHTGGIGRGQRGSRGRNRPRTTRTTRIDIRRVRRERRGARLTRVLPQPPSAARRPLREIVRDRPSSGSNDAGCSRRLRATMAFQSPLERSVYSASSVARIPRNPRHYRPRSLANIRSYFAMITSQR